MPLRRSLLETFMDSHSHDCGSMIVGRNGLRFVQARSLPGRSKNRELLGGVGEDGAALVGDDHGVLDADPAVLG